MPTTIRTPDELFDLPQDTVIRCIRSGHVGQVNGPRDSEATPEQFEPDGDRGYHARYVTWVGIDEVRYQSYRHNRDWTKILPAEVIYLPSPPALEEDTATRCRWCGEEIGPIHYSDGDRWQPTPMLGDDFCEERYDMQNGSDTQSPEYRHEP